MPTRAAWHAPQSQLSGGSVQPTTLGAFNFKVLIVFLFIMFSRIFEVELVFLHIPGITYRLLALFLLLTGTFAAAYRESIGKCVLGFTFFFLLACAFSIWRSGSIQVLTNQWIVAVIVFTASAALIPDFRGYVSAVKTIAIAIVVLTIICEFKGTVENGRLFLEEGRFSNPNEMAQALLLGMPFVWAVYSKGRGGKAKAFGAGALLIMLYVISRTGSRGALITIAVIVACMFVRASILGKMKVLVGAALLFLIAAFTISGDLKVRYQTFFSESSDEQADPAADQEMLISAVASTDNREQMFKRSLIVTARHPLFGVGPGQFEVAEDEMARAEGKRKGAWVGTHNSFTEVSSECGIPAFLFYMGILVLSFQKSYRVYRAAKGSPDLEEISTHALALNYSLIAFIVTGVFIHAAYTALLPVLAGFTISLVRTTEHLLVRRAGGPIDFSRGRLVQARS